MVKNETQTFYYINPTACINNSKSYGTIVIQSEASTPHHDANTLEQSMPFSIYPNPFNHSIHIEYALKANSSVQLRLLNVLNQEIATITNRSETSGYHELKWDIKPDLAPGSYIVQFSVNGRHCRLCPSFDRTLKTSQQRIERNGLSLPLRSYVGDLAHTLNVLHRRHTELPLKLTAELRRTFVSNRLGGGAGIVAVMNHQALRSI